VWSSEKLAASALGKGNGKASNLEAPARNMRAKRLWKKFVTWQVHFKHRLDYFLNATVWGAAIESTNVIISTSSVILYVMVRDLTPP
jgi:hypothetical protein